MITIKPFKALRPHEAYVEKVSALPYDVVTDEEVREVVKDNPYSFLRVDKADALVTEGEDVYQKAADTLSEQIAQGVFVEEEVPALYIYGLEVGDQKQYGVVGCFSVNDYTEGRIKKHENTRQDKEEDRINHVAACQAHTGPIFMTYKKDEALEKVIQEVKQEAPVYDFTDAFGVRQVVYALTDASKQEVVVESFCEMDALYIADGHHRAAAACSYAKTQGGEDALVSECQSFLGVAFPKDDLVIMAYNRLVKYDEKIEPSKLWQELEKVFHVEKQDVRHYTPDKRHTIGMRFHQVWYALSLKEGVIDERDAVASLDVSILQKFVLEPVFGITEPRTDQRLSFVGGIRGIEALNEGSESEACLAFSMYPTSLDELLAVADAERLMPPKSTWFEPKLRSGLFIHKF
ncbi:MAG: DUF1015 domain-containing protein [Cellulosilyticaceae bacterium]